MPQSLNLYTRSLCQRRYRDTFGQMLAIQALIATLGGLAGAVLHGSAEQEQRQVESLMQQISQARDALKQSSTDRPDGVLVAQVQRLRDQEAGLRRLQTLLDNGSAGRRQGYADHLEALARQAHASVWITGLTLQGADDSIELQGRMTDPALLTDYLRQLQAEPQFKGRSFAALNIQQAGTPDAPANPPGHAPGSPYSEFTLRSHLTGHGNASNSPRITQDMSASAAAQAAVQMLTTPGTLVAKP